jgi:hypothetical protein
MTAEGWLLVAPGDMVKVIMRGTHRAGWVEVIEVAGNKMVVETPDGIAEVEQREVDGWRPA